ncbi:MAG: AraC family transcriptional regulator [Treponema sp.]|nr:AraC family transcriptional regulator [Treponema sp.]
MEATNIIQRRDLDPLWARACEIARHYERAGNCISVIIGSDYIAMEPSKHPKSGLFCSLCRRYHSNRQDFPLSDSPCSSIHRDAVRKAIRLGSSYIYSCSVGFYFWTSPFFSMERFAGAFISSGALALEKEQVLDKVFRTCKGDVSRAEIAGHLECLPEKSIVDIEALAQLLTICTDHISRRDAYRGMWVEHAGGELEDQDGNYWGCLPKGYLPDFIDKERMLLANLRRGDSVEAQNIARELLGDICNVLNVSMGGSAGSLAGGRTGGNFDYLKLKTMEMVVLLSRSGATEEKNEMLVEASGHYLKRIKDSKTVNEVVDNFCLIVERMAGKLFSFQGIRHASALRKAERFIWENYTRKVSLKEIADVSNLSAPYFSTIFKDEMGENLSDYLNRLRVEKATAMLRETDLRISEISAACGFEDQSWFSKIFKNHTGISPCKYRKTVGVIPLEQNFNDRQVVPS